MIRFFAAVSGALMLSAFTGAASGQSALRSCEQLAKFKLTGAELVIAKTEVVSAAASIPAYCRVDGTIDPRTGGTASPMASASQLLCPPTGTAAFCFREVVD